MHAEQPMEQARLDQVVVEIDQQLDQAKIAYAQAHSETPSRLKGKLYCQYVY